MCERGQGLRLFAGAACVVAACMAFGADSPVTTDVCVFRGGQAIGGRGNSVVRIPALVEAFNGDLVAVADARPWTGDDLRFGRLQPVRVVVSRSSDGGKTWTDPVLKNGDFGVLFEGPHYGKIRFARVSRKIKSINQLTKTVKAVKK